MHKISVLLAAVLPTLGLAQQTLWGQCGGIGWTGATTCVSGACCTYGNAYYSQCLSGSCSSAVPSSTVLSPSSTVKPTSTTAQTTTVPSATGTFTNPVIYEDFADNDVFRGPDDAFYFSASNMHYSPGAPILKSYDLVNWEFIGHSVPSLSWGSGYDMADNQTSYLGGTWASTMRYRQSNGLWYWIGCVNFWRSYVYTAPAVTGPWTLTSTIDKCYYDCGLLIDDDDIMYVVHGGTTINLAQLSADGLSEVRTKVIMSASSDLEGMEGNRLYKRNGVYYILNDHPSTGSTYIWKTSNLWGTWTSKLMNKGIGSPVAGAGAPHQGSLVETQTGAWYFMSFTWAYPAGRMPVLAPVTWGSDGYPVLTKVNEKWGESYPYPLPAKQVPAWTGTDSFQGTSLGVRWEWNHNPDTSKYSVNNGLTLRTVTVTNDLYKARNTLTHRVHGPLPVATILLDFSNMADGDRTGLAAFRDQSAYIGVARSGNSYSVIMAHGLTQSTTNWETTSTGTIAATAAITKGRVWLRGSMDARPSGAKTVKFSYSTDGTTFVALGTSATLNVDWRYFIGYRWGIFAFTTKALGGSVLVSSFSQS